MGVVKAENWKCHANVCSGRVEIELAETTRKSKYLRISLSCMGVHLKSRKQGLYFVERGSPYIVQC